ncbi:hypothetical protein ACG873_23305 [Mesorhizobium sp. AaZ16]|uniref:hypothetical protein n=1 Tax=Mesorhizobium sp. AaZ16 TaxID=3402289 RepID=UPI00374F4EA0
MNRPVSVLVVAAALILPAAAETSGISAENLHCSVYKSRALTKDGWCDVLDSGSFRVWIFHNGGEIEFRHKGRKIYVGKTELVELTPECLTTRDGRYQFCISESDSFDHLENDQ